MGRFSRQPQPLEPPEDQTGKHPVKPSSSDPKEAKQTRLTNDRSLLSQANEAQKDENPGLAQYLRRMIGD